MKQRSPSLMRTFLIEPLLLAGAYQMPEMPRWEIDLTLRKRFIVQIWPRFVSLNRRLYAQKSFALQCLRAQPRAHGRLSVWWSTSAGLSVKPHHPGPHKADCLPALPYVLLGDQKGGCTARLVSGLALNSDLIMMCGFANTHS